MKSSCEHAQQGNDDRQEDAREDDAVPHEEKNSLFPVGFLHRETHDTLETGVAESATSNSWWLSFLDALVDLGTAEECQERQDDGEEDHVGGVASGHDVIGSFVFVHEVVDDTIDGTTKGDVDS